MARTSSYGDKKLCALTLRPGKSDTQSDLCSVLHLRTSRIPCLGAHRDCGTYQSHWEHLLAKQACPTIGIEIMTGLRLGGCGARY